MRVLTLSALAALLAGCQSGTTGAGPADGGGDGGTSGDGGATTCAPGALDLTPAAPSLTLDGSPTLPALTFTARSGGATVAATGLTWSAARADDTPPGAVAAGVFSPYPYAGGSVTVTAADTCGHSAAATVTLTLNAVVNPPAPATQARFSGTVVTGDLKAPSIVYPNDQTRFPRNIYKQLFQWRKNGGDLFRITFDGPGSMVQVYTDGVHSLCAAANPPAGCWESDVTAWAFIASSNAGRTVTVTIDGVLPSDPNVYRSSSIQIAFSRRDVSGAIFYWSTTAAGVRRASVSDAVPEAYVVAKPTATVLPSAGTVQCVACHTVSRSGKKMIGGTQTASFKGMFAFDVKLRPPPVDTLHPIMLSPTSPSPFREFGTFSPDDSRLVMGNAGALAMYDAATGALITGNLLPVATKGTQPDWSPDGTRLAFAVGAGEKPAAASSIAVVHYLGNDLWGVPAVVAPASDGTTLYNMYPSFSPAGDWIAYNRSATAGHGDKTAQLWIVKFDGSEKKELKNANRWVNNVLTTGQYENYMPTWAPSGDYQWIAFNSLRPYGVVYPTGGTQQIWVAAVDLATGAPDPSFPAFRFSFQDVAENNHRAFWTIDVRSPPDGGYVDGGCAYEACLDGGLGDGGATDGGADAGAGDGGADAGADGGVDGGACLPVGTACDQVSGPPCCSGTVCDLAPDGGFACIIFG